MNTAEHEVLDAETMPDDAYVLYSKHFRRFMNYENGRVLVSYSKLRQRMEFTPRAGSKAKPSKPSLGKIRSLIDTLIWHGLIRKVEKGDRLTGKPAVFVCVLATSDLNRLNEEQHQSNTRTTLDKKTSNVFDLKACGAVGRNSFKQHEQHSSEYSEQEDIYTREALIFDNQFLGMSQQAMLICSETDLSGYFDSFRFSTKDDGSAKPLSAHLKAWRQYCVSIRGNLNKNEGGQHAKRGRFSNGSSEQYEQSQRAIERCIDQGIDGSALDEAVEAYNAVRGNAKT